MTELLEPRCDACDGEGECSQCYGNDDDCFFCEGSGECCECDGTGTVVDE